MHDQDPRVDLLIQIAESISLIERRIASIASPIDLVNSAEGMTILDSICMRLQVIGETVKKLHSLAPESLNEHPAVPWNEIMKLRDIISHHYVQIDHEIIYDACTHDLKALKTATQHMLNSIDRA